MLPTHPRTHAPTLLTHARLRSRAHGSRSSGSLIITTSYQKLPFGSWDYPDKLLFHQALNEVSNSSDRELPRDMFRLCYHMIRNNVVFVVFWALYSDRLQELQYCSHNVPPCKTFLGYVRAYRTSPGLFCPGRSPQHLP